jgi:hypothetical protein
MIVFGAAEVATSITHEFFGLSTARVVAATIVGAAVGILYAAAGVLILLMKRWAAQLAISFLVAVILGRIAIVATGLYPVDSFKQAAAIAAGTLIVAAFALYIRFKWPAFK